MQSIIKDEESECCSLSKGKRIRSLTVEAHQWVCAAQAQQKLNGDE